VVAVGSGEEALEAASKKACPIAFVDVKLPLMDGLQTYLRLKDMNPELAAVMMTGYRDEVKDQLEKAQEASAIACLFKPFDPLKAVEMVSQIRAKYKGEPGRENARQHTGS
jgi:CheY-like chemotaxis protein